MRLLILLSLLLTSIPAYSLEMRQWGLDYIHAQDAWAYSQGEGTVVAVIDTGVDVTHPDLKDNIWTNSDEIPDNGIDDDQNGYIDDTNGWDFIDNATELGCDFVNDDCEGADGNLTDGVGHGTHVAGIIAAADNNQGITGVAPKTKIMPLKVGYKSVLSRTGMKTSYLVDAIYYAIHNGADVINMSLGTTFPDKEVLKAVQLAFDNNIVVVASAGNARSSGPHYPSSYPEVLSVGWIQEDGTHGRNSNFGALVDIAAPGQDILSTAPGNRYVYKTGTSMAAPHVAGVAALIKSMDIEKKLTGTAIKNIIIDSAQLIDDTKFKLALEADVVMPAVNTKQALDTAFNVAIIKNKKRTKYKARFQKLKTKLSRRYVWTSNVQGEISTDKILNISSLEPGEHLLSVRVFQSRGTFLYAYDQIKVLVPETL